jgi:hypothetical protein
MHTVFNTFMYVFAYVHCGSDSVRMYVDLVAGEVRVYGLR